MLTSPVGAALTDASRHCTAAVRTAPAWGLAALLVAAVLGVSPAPADEPAQERSTTSAAGGAEADAPAGCDACALRHQSKLRNRDRLRALREQQKHNAATEDTEVNRGHAE